MGSEPHATAWSLRTSLHVIPPALVGLVFLGLRLSVWQADGASLGMTVLIASPPGFLVYAATTFFIRVWPRGSVSAKALWISVAPTIAVGLEVGQAAGLFPGQFEPLDLMTSVVGTCLALIVGTWSREGEALMPPPEASTVDPETTRSTRQE